MNVMDASELYDPEFRKLIKSKKQTVIIPVGSLEQHGAHLPITTDSDIVTEIASRLGKKCNFIVLPTINYGVSYEHSPLFNTSIDGKVLGNILMNIIHSLKENNVNSIIILNGHHGNDRIIGTLRSVSSYSYWHFMKHEFDHAGFVETSIMLAISDKVKMKKAKKGLITKGLSNKEIQRINKLSTKPGGFPKVAKNGVWGDPTKATKKDGKKFLAEIVRNLTKECQS
uniref:Creatininase n=3 Tax=environmental samples TaxID=651140 RepID=A0A075GWC7_9ARCH|nr:creatininase [uncultured marine thaumarchaeote KM3_26_G04]